MNKLNIQSQLIDGIQKELVGAYNEGELENCAILASILRDLSSAYKDIFTVKANQATASAPVVKDRISLSGSSSPMATPGRRVDRRVGSGGFSRGFMPQPLSEGERLPPQPTPPTTYDYPDGFRGVTLPPNPPSDRGLDTLPSQEY